MVEAALRGATGPLGLLLNVVRGAVWLYEYYLLIESYFDPPKSLEDLIRDASLGPSRGYDIHHIVEQRPAELDGFPRSLIDGPGNLVRIPRMRHWEVNRWFETPNRSFSWSAPRQHARGRDWSERFAVGLLALEETGILKP